VLACQRQRCHAVEVGHREIRQDDVRRESFQLPQECFLAVHDTIFKRDACAPEFTQRELGVVFDVLDEKEAYHGHRTKPRDSAHCLFPPHASQSALRF
jgi:hypothetical protein